MPAALKLGLLFLATVILASTSNLWFHGAVFLATVILYLLPGWLFFSVGLRRLFILWPFVVVVLAWHIWSGATTAGLVIVLRMMSAVALANLVTMTTRLSDMMAVVHRLTAPFARFGLNLRALEICIALVIRMIPVLAQKGQLLSQSWRARSTRKPRWCIVLPLALCALEDADRVAEALRARGGLIDLQER
jgi:biotin transport system permease protein